MIAENFANGNQRVVSAILATIQTSCPGEAVVVAVVKRLHQRHHVCQQPKFCLAMDVLTDLSQVTDGASMIEDIYDYGYAVITHS